MTRAMSVLLVAAALPMVGGCTRELARLGDKVERSALTRLMPPCASIVGAPPATVVRGGIKVFLPNSLALDDIDRHVRYLPGPIEQRDAFDARHDRDGLVNEEPARLNQKPPPFHINLHGLDLPGRGFLIVQLISPSDATYSFFAYGRIQGVVAGQDDGDAALCANTMVAPSPRGPGSRQVATFYVDLSKPITPGHPRTFQIGLVPQRYADSVIFIDPKVHNEG